MVRIDESVEADGIGDAASHHSPFTIHYSPLTIHQQHLNRLRWRCRRGMLELDLPLARFLEEHYPGATEEEKDAFARLLDYTDPDLWELVRDGRPTGDAALDRVVKRLHGDGQDNDFEMEQKHD